MTLVFVDNYLCLSFEFRLRIGKWKVLRFKTSFVCFYFSFCLQFNEIGKSRSSEIGTTKAAYLSFFKEKKTFEFIENLFIVKRSIYPNAIQNPERFKSVYGVHSYYMVCLFLTKYNQSVVLRKTKKVWVRNCIFFRSNYY